MWHAVSQVRHGVRVLLWPASWFQNQFSNVWFNVPGVGFGFFALFPESVDHTRGTGSFCCRVSLEPSGAAGAWDAWCACWVGVGVGGHVRAAGEEGHDILTSSPGTRELIATIAGPLRRDFISLENCGDALPSVSVPSDPHKCATAVERLNVFWAITKPVHTVWQERDILNDS